MSLIGAEITVVGAGVAGLAVARALAMRGASVTVLEQSDAIREVGAGLQISPNGAAVLRALELGAELSASGLRAEAVELRDGPSGDQVLRLDLGGLRPSAEYRFLHRADLISLLLQGARDAGVELRLLHRIESVDLAGQRPKLRLTTGAEIVTDLLIGADGLHSKVRAAINGTVAPFFTHQVAWRATIPEHPGAPPVAEVHMGPGRHLVSYPLRGGAMRNIVAVEERARWAEESWSLRDDPMDLRLAFEGFSPRIRTWLEAVADVGLWGLFRHPVARAWQSGGRVAILGDAAHPTLPFLAQGANLALEDAWVLAASLAGSEAPEAGLAAYQAMRVGRAARVVEAANRNARVYHLRAPIAGIAQAGMRVMGAVAPGMALRRLDWLYGHDVTSE